MFQMKVKGGVKMQNNFLECDKCCTKIFDYDAFGESKYEIINNEILCVPCLEKGGFLNDN